MENTKKYTNYEIEVKDLQTFLSVHPTYQRDYYITKPIENAVYYFYE